MHARRHAVIRSERRGNRTIGLAVALVVGGALAAGGVVLTGNNPTPTASSTQAPAPAQAAVGGAPEQPAGPPDCTGMVSGMDDRQKLAQRLMVGVDAADPAGAAAIVRDSQVGGIFIGGNDTALLRDDNLADVQKAADVPVAVGVDDEGGRVQRIDDLVGDLPSARAMAKKTPEQVTELARDRAQKLRDVGITWNLAPDVDVSDQPSNDVIGDRSFSDDPATVTKYALAWAEGQEQGGVYGMLKHFPGHGRSSGDSHKGEVSVPSLAELEKTDLKPYESLVGPGNPLDGRTGVMVGHLDVPGLTTDVPSSLEPATYQLLRTKYRFDGLVMTDDLGAMKAITDRFGLAASTTKALSAGADVALFSNVTQVSPLLDAAQKALDDGTIDRAGNDTAVARVLAAKGLCRR
ncbi:glycoside hydrolase family 3 N-terminal domain-containing protein [Pseudonocardia endophytica]|uniref:beta-N-acetylhexosaminidase n=1 Tax=Pseudonocardia endophytica TaxID=401976 RepID=A0A4R1HTP2_PSEEN|nr:glycoside hydrolase family 3 N-terminal domain-containing protein [Pseudonocardia endophytica]TCK26054.1 beta-N-acetylhexosaminidase [Pseudonocardia endophytica]